MSRLETWKRLILEEGDPSTELGRAHQRKRRILLAGVAGGGAKAVSLMTLFLTVPLTLGYLGHERYGIWMAISSLLAVLNFADFGLGNGLLNTLSKSEGLGDSQGSRKTVSSAFFMLLGIASVLGLALLAAWPWIDWGRFFNARSPETSLEAGHAVAVFAVTFLAGLPLSVVPYSYSALQEGFRASLYQIAGSLLGLAAILLALKMQAGLGWLVLAASGAPLLATLAGGCELYFRRRPDLRPSLGHASKRGAIELSNLGGLFLVIQVAMTMAYQTDSLVLTRIMGPEAVAVYAVTQKLFMQVPFLLGYFLAPLWPAYVEALARKDHAWVRGTLRKSLILGFAVNVPAALALYFLAPLILELWVKGAIVAPPALLMSLALWAGLNSLNGPIGMFLNGVGAVKFQAVICVLMAVANLSLSIYLTEKIGIAGVVVGSITAQILFSSLPSLFYIRRWLGKMEAL